MYLLDTNILIYFLQGKKPVMDFINKSGQSRFAISIISRLEFLLGLQYPIFVSKEFDQYLDLFENINLDKLIVAEAVLLSSKLNKKLKFKDLIIAATANLTGKTIVTADKDFQKLTGVKVKLLEIS